MVIEPSAPFGTCPPAKFRVAIIGAGPGGLALAVALDKFNDPRCPVVVDIYESQSEIGTVGAGLSVWPRTRPPLNELGLMEHLKDELGAVVEEGMTGKGFLYRKSDEPEGYPLHQMMSASNPLLVHRSAFVHAIKKEMAPSPLCTVHTCKRLKSVTQDDAHGEVTLHFADGSTARADAVVGADGIRSAVRASMFPEGKRIEPLWSGVTAYRALVTKEKLEENGFGDHPLGKEPRQHCGKGKHIVSYPISREGLVNVVALVTSSEPTKAIETKWVRDAPVEEVREAFAGWEPEVQAFLNSIESAQAWALHIVLDLPTAATGRMTILGDAMHAMETNVGAGAGQAIEDAYILARLLTHPSTTRATVPQALQAYSTARLDWTMSIVRQTHHFGRLLEFNEGPVPFLPKDSEWQKRWGKEVDSMWDLQMHSDGAEKSWIEAEGYLRENMAELKAMLD